MTIGSKEMDFFCLSWGVPLAELAVRGVLDVDDDLSAGVLDVDVFSESICNKQMKKMLTLSLPNKLSLLYFLSALIFKVLQCRSKFDW